jgi:hypothetical protein
VEQPRHSRNVPINSNSTQLQIVTKSFLNVADTYIARSSFLSGLFDQSAVRSPTRSAAGEHRSNFDHRPSAGEQSPSEWNTLE